MTFSVYIIKNPDNELYVGITTNTDERVRCHNLNRGAHFTKFKANFKLVFKEEYNTLREVRTREIQIKKWRRDKKEMLIQRYSEGLLTKI